MENEKIAKMHQWILAEYAVAQKEYFDLMEQDEEELGQWQRVSLRLRIEKAYGGTQGLMAAWAACNDVIAEREPGVTAP